MSERANLGLATTRELLEEISARISLGACCLNYSTVTGETHICERAALRATPAGGVQWTYDTLESEFAKRLQDMDPMQAFHATLHDAGFPMICDAAHECGNATPAEREHDLMDLVVRAAMAWYRDCDVPDYGRERGLYEACRSLAVYQGQPTPPPATCGMATNPMTSSLAPCPHKDTYKWDDGALWCCDCGAFFLQSWNEWKLPRRAAG